MTKKWTKTYVTPESIIDVEEDIYWAFNHDDVVPDYETWDGKLIITMEYVEDDNVQINSN